MTKQTLEKLKNKTAAIFRRYGVIRASIFGSAARGDNTTNSDIDFLIKFSRGATLFDLGGLKVDLEKKLSREVDVISVGGIKKSFGTNIKEDLVNLYEKKR